MSVSCASSPVTWENFPSLLLPLSIFWTLRINRFFFCKKKFSKSFLTKTVRNTNAIFPSSLFFCCRSKCCVYFANAHPYGGIISCPISAPDSNKSAKEETESEKREISVFDSNDNPSLPLFLPLMFQSMSRCLDGLDVFAAIRRWPSEDREEVIVKSGNEHYNSSASKQFLFYSLSSSSPFLFSLFAAHFLYLRGEEKEEVERQKKKSSRRRERSKVFEPQFNCFSKERKKEGKRKKERERRKEMQSQKNEWEFRMEFSFFPSFLPFIRLQYGVNSHWLTMVGGGRETIRGQSGRMHFHPFLQESNKLWILR